LRSSLDRLVETILAVLSDFINFIRRPEKAQDLLFRQRNLLEFNARSKYRAVWRRVLVSIVASPGLCRSEAAMQGEDTYDQPKRNERDK